MKRGLSVLITAVALTLASIPLTSCGGEKVCTRSGVVLGDAIVLRVSAKGENSETAVGRMFDLADEVFKEMDLSNKDGALSRFNASSSTKPQKIGSHIYKILVLAKKAHALSFGAFDVTALPLSKLWGVDIEGIHSRRPDERDIMGSATTVVPSYESVQDALLHVGMDKIEFYESGEEYFVKKTDPLTKVDLGGIAKGYFADLCVSIASDMSLTSCLIDLSGNIYLYGGGLKSGGDWNVGIIDPRPRITAEGLRGHVAVVKCAGNRSFVTSGDYQRFYYYNPVGGESGREEDLIAVCHIIDPRSGLPVGVKYEDGNYKADTDAVCSATVSGASSALCDALSTAATVLEIRDVKLMLESADLSGLVFTSPDAFGKGKIASVGEWDFLDGYDGYKTGYEALI